ncbi:MAG TPA: hypothetical protein VF472_12630 [Burkholderiaceae bacterium]
MSTMPPDNSYSELFTNFMQGWFNPNQMRRLFNTLYEPILPNGTFAGLVINQNNSSNPQVERHVVNHYSYGRQLGILIDAVDVLIKDVPSPKDKRDAGRIKALKDLKSEIEKLKSQARESQAEHIIDELEELSDADLRRCGDEIARLRNERAGR